MVINRVRVLGRGPHTPTQFFWEYPASPGPLSTVVSTAARELEQNALIYFPFLGQCFLFFQLIHIFSGCNLVLLIIIKRPLSSVIRSSFPLTTSISVNNSATTTVWQYIDCCTCRGNFFHNWTTKISPEIEISRSVLFLTSLKKG